MKDTNWASSVKVSSGDYAWAKLSDDQQWHVTDGTAPALIVCMAQGIHFFWL